MHKPSLFNMDLRVALCGVIFLFMVLAIALRQENVLWPALILAVGLIIPVLVGLTIRQHRELQQRNQAAEVKLVLIPHWSADGKIGPAPLLFSLLKYLEAAQLVTCSDWAGLQHCLTNLGCLPRSSTEKVIWISGKSNLVHLRNGIKDQFQVPAKGINLIFAGLFCWKEEDGSLSHFTNEDFIRLCSKAKNSGWGKQERINQLLQTFFTKNRILPPVSP